MPILAATSAMGSSRALRAISRSGGNVTAMTACSCRAQLCQRLLAPALGGLDLVEGEEVEAGHVALGRGQVGQQTGRESLGVITAGPHHSHEPVGMAAPASRRV